MSLSGGNGVGGSRGGGADGPCPPHLPGRKKKEGKKTDKKKGERGEKTGTTIEGCEDLTPRGGGHPPPNLNIHEIKKNCLLGFPS